jgi:hypothetical protein
MRLCAGFLNRSVTRATATQVVGRSILTKYLSQAQLCLRHSDSRQAYRLSACTLLNNAFSLINYEQTNAGYLLIGELGGGESIEANECVSGLVVQ